MVRCTAWLTQPPISFDDAESTSLQGARVRTLPSPNDLPIAARLIVEDSFLTIQFAYLSDEPTSAGTYAYESRLTYGRASGRIFAIRIIREPNWGIDKLKRDFDKAVVSYRRVAEASRHSMNLSRHIELVRKTMNRFLVRLLTMAEREEFIGDNGDGR
jgi:hypothetical protein